MALLADKLGQAGVLADCHAHQALEIREEDLVQVPLLLRVLTRHGYLPKSVSQAPGGKLPMAKAAVARAQGPADSFMEENDDRSSIRDKCTNSPKKLHPVHMCVCGMPGLSHEENPANLGVCQAQ